MEQKSVADVLYVSVGPEQFEPVELRYSALRCDHWPCGAVGLTEVGVSCGDDPADPPSVGRVVEEVNHLVRDCSFRAAAVGRGHQDKRAMDR